MAAYFQAWQRCLALTSTLILLVAAWVLLHFVIHIVVWVASVAIVIAAIVALVWAVRVLL